MKNPAKKVLTVALAITMFLIPKYALSQEQSNAEQTSATKQDVSESAPDLGEIISKATKLSAALAALKIRVADAPDVSEFEKDVAEIEENLKEPAAQLLQLKDAKDDRLNKLVELKKVIERKNKIFEENSIPLSEAISQFGTWRNDWLAKKQQWSQWQSALLEEGDLAQLQPTFARAKDTIDRALEIVVIKLISMLMAQERAGSIQAKIIAFSTELDALILAARSSTHNKVAKIQIL